MFFLPFSVHGLKECVYLLLHQVQNLAIKLVFVLVLIERVKATAAAKISRFVVTVRIVDVSLLRKSNVCLVELFNRGAAITNITVQVCKKNDSVHETVK
jgi:hypothetical protein